MSGTARMWHHRNGPDWIYSLSQLPLTLSHMASPLRARARDTIVFGGLTAGVLDIADAFVVAWLNGGTAVRVLHAIASGLLGRAAYDGGAPAAALGLFLHFFIATAAATAFYLGSLKLPFLLRRPLLWGPVFGLCVWAVMYQIVLPIDIRAAVHDAAAAEPAQSARHSRVGRRPADRAVGELVRSTCDDDIANAAPRRLAPSICSQADLLVAPLHRYRKREPGAPLPRGVEPTFACTFCVVCGSDVLARGGRPHGGHK